MENMQIICHVLKSMKIYLCFILFILFGRLCFIVNHILANKNGERLMLIGYCLFKQLLFLR